MKLIGLTGLPRAGKDSFAHHMCLHYGYKAFAFAGALKEAAAILLDRPLEQMHGIDGFDREAELPEWGFSTRWFLQQFGTECLRKIIRSDFWVQRLLIELKKLPANVKVVITDVRFENETAMIRELGGQIIEIVRPGQVRSQHVSDAGVKMLPHEVTVDNSGTLEQLYQVVDALLSPDGVNR